MPDDSRLDRKYFIDNYKYNCPFCNRRHVSYLVRRSQSFDWTDNKKCFAYFVECDSCKHISMHLSFTELPMDRTHPSSAWYRFKDDVGSIDDYIFYSVPTSFFVIDKNIPSILRELFTEAEGCLKSNFLTGASVCIRKVIYELALREEAEGNTYDERIKSLKSIKPEVDPTYFDTLLTIQQLTSEKVHENAYDGWESKHIRLILASLSEILHEIYVIPEGRKTRRKALLELKEKVVGEKGKPSDTSNSDGVQESGQESA